MYSITLDPDPESDLEPDLEPDLDPNWAKILDPDPNSMFLDPQHWLSDNWQFRYFNQNLRGEKYAGCHFKI